MENLLKCPSTERAPITQMHLFASVNNDGAQEGSLLLWQTEGGSTNDRAFDHTLSTTPVPHVHENQGLVRGHRSEELKR